MDLTKSKSEYFTVSCGYHKDEPVLVTENQGYAEAFVRDFKCPECGNTGWRYIKAHNYANDS